MKVSIVGAMGLSRIGAMELTPVGANPLTLVGADLSRRRSQVASDRPAVSVRGDFAVGVNARKDVPSHSASVRVAEC
jgi:hypothetical protein